MKGYDLHFLEWLRLVHCMSIIGATSDSQLFSDLSVCRITKTVCAVPPSFLNRQILRGVPNAAQGVFCFHHVL